MTPRQVRLANKIFSFLSAFLLVFNSFAPSLTYLSNLATPAYAEEPTVQTDPTPTDTPEPTGTDPVATPTPSVEPTAEPTVVPETSPTPEATTSAVPTSEPTLVATPTPTNTPADSATPAPTGTDPEGTPAPTSEPTPTLIPTITTPAEPVVHGDLSAVVLPNVSADSLNVDLSTTSSNQSATLTTDKADYAPTDTAVISGSNFATNTTYTLNITSSDEPSVDFNIDVVTDESGSFVYAYQLDGTYRPNYQVFVKLGTTVIASTTFTDSNKVTICHKNNGSGWTENSVNSDSVDGSGSGDHNRNGHQNGDDIIPPFYENGSNGYWTARNWDTAGQSIWEHGCRDDRATITIIKDAQPDDGQNFTFSYNPPGHSNTTSFTLDDDGNNSNAYKNNKTYDHLDAGNYVVTESSVSGWNLTSIVCDTGESIDLGDREATISLSINEQVTCTFTNQKKGSIKIVKNVDPGYSYDDFHFHTTGSGLSNFTLEDDGNESMSDDYRKDKTFSNLTPRTYTITEDYYSDWSVTDISCNGEQTIDLANRKVTIDLSVGEDITCTFTNSNTPPTGNIIVHKDVLSATGLPTTDTTSFTVLLDGGNSQQITDGNTVTYSDVSIGAHTISEGTLPTGYTQYSITRGGNITVEAGDNNVYIVNQQNAGSISGYKFDASSGEGISGWEIFLTGESEDSVFTDADGFYQFLGLNTGSYTVTEESRTGWTAVDGTSHSLTIDPGTESTKNNFTNFENISVTVCKVEDEDGSTRTDEDQSAKSGWGVSLYDGESTDEQTTGEDGCYTWSDLGPGDYSVSEETRDGWTALTDTTYDLTAVSGSDQTVTFVNHRDTGTINITKEIKGEGTVEGWQFDIEGVTDDTSDPKIDTTDSEGDTTTGLIKTGTYTLSENARERYHFVDAVCTTETQEGRFSDNTVGEWDEESQMMVGIELGKDQTINCTFTNEQDPANIHITKSNDKSGVSLNSGDVINYTIQITNLDSEEVLAGPALNVVVQDVPPTGTYFEYLSSTGLLSVNGGPSTPITATGTNPYFWSIGTVNAGDTVTITYQVKVKNGVTPGTYTNFAYATGNDANGDDLSTDPVSSDVQVGSVNNLTASGSRTETGQVLGASTSVLGAATGPDTSWLIISLMLMSSGLGFKFANKKHEQI